MQVGQRIWWLVSDLDHAGYWILHTGEIMHVFESGLAKIQTASGERYVNLHRPFLTDKPEKLRELVAGVCASITREAKDKCDNLTNQMDAAIGSSPTLLEKWPRQDFNDY